MRRETLGDKHPHTLISILSLSYLIVDQGEEEEEDARMSAQRRAMAPPMAKPPTKTRCGGTPRSSVQCLTSASSSASKLALPGESPQCVCMLPKLLGTSSCIAKPKNTRFKILVD